MKAESLRVALPLVLVRASAVTAMALSFAAMLEVVAGSASGKVTVLAPSVSRALALTVALTVTVLVSVAALAPAAARLSVNNAARAAKDHFLFI